jgi:hypothetical protein
MNDRAMQDTGLEAFIVNPAAKTRPSNIPSLYRPTPFIEKHHGLIAALAVESDLDENLTVQGALLNDTLEDTDAKCKERVNRFNHNCVISLDLLCYIAQYAI